MTSARPCANVRQRSQLPPPRAMPTTRALGASRARNGSSTSIACSRLVRGGVELEAGDGLGQRHGRTPGRRGPSRRGSSRPRAARRPNRTPSRVCFGPMTITSSGISSRLKHRGRELARVRRGPRAGPSPPPTSRAAVRCARAGCRPVRMQLGGRRDRTSPPRPAGGSPPPRTGSGSSGRSPRGSVDCAARLSSAAVSGFRTLRPPADVARRSSGDRRGAKTQALWSCSMASRARRAGSKPRRSGAGERAVHGRVGEDASAQPGTTPRRRGHPPQRLGRARRAAKSVAWSGSPGRSASCGRSAAAVPTGAPDRHGQRQARDGAVGDSEAGSNSGSSPGPSATMLSRACPASCLQLVGAPTGEAAGWRAGFGTLRRTGRRTRGSRR